MDAGVWAFGALIAILIGVGLLLGMLVFWIWAIVDAARFTEDEWRAVGQSKNVWAFGVIVAGGLLGHLFGVFFAGLLAPLVYVVWPRRQLRANRRAFPGHGGGYLPPLSGGGYGPQGPSLPPPPVHPPV